MIQQRKKEQGISSSGSGKRKGRRSRKKKEEVDIESEDGSLVKDKDLSTHEPSDEEISYSKSDSSYSSKMAGSSELDSDQEHESSSTML